MVACTPAAHGGPTCCPGLACASPPLPPRPRSSRRPTAASRRRSPRRCGSRHGRWTPAGLPHRARPGDRRCMVRADAPRGRAAALAVPRASGPLPGTSVLRVAGEPLAVGERVRLRKLRPVRRAQLVVLVRDESVLTYARFGALGRLGPRAIVRSRRTAGGVAVELAGRRARELRRGRIRAPAAPPPPVPPAPPPARPTPARPPPGWSSRSAAASPRPRRRRRRLQPALGGGPGRPGLDRRRRHVLRPAPRRARRVDLRRHLRRPCDGRRPADRGHGPQHRRHPGRPVPADPRDRDRRAARPADHARRGGHVVLAGGRDGRGRPPARARLADARHRARPVGLRGHRHGPRHLRPAGPRAARDPAAARRARDRLGRRRRRGRRHHLRLRREQRRPARPGAPRRALDRTSSRRRGSTPPPTAGRRTRPRRPRSCTACRTS